MIDYYYYYLLRYIVINTFPNHPEYIYIDTHILEQLIGKKLEYIVDSNCFSFKIVNTGNLHSCAFFNIYLIKGTKRNKKKKKRKKESLSTPPRFLDFIHETRVLLLTVCRHVWSNGYQSPLSLNFQYEQFPVPGPLAKKRI